MAIQTRLYVLCGPSNAELRQFVDPTVSVQRRYRTAVCQLQYDDSVVDIVQTMDDYMAQQWGLDNGQPQKDPGFISGLVPSYVSASVVQLSKGYCVASNDKDPIELAAAVNIDITVIGVNGLDVGPEVASNWYYVYVIGDSMGVNPTAGILSASQNGPTVMPAGYDVYRRVGTVRNQSGDFRAFQVIGNGNYREVQYRDALTSRLRLPGGSAIAGVDGVVAVSCGPVIPNTSALGLFQIGQRGTVDAWIYDDPTQPLATYQRLVRPGLVITDRIRVSGGRDIAYTNSAAGGLVDVYVTGYQESI